MVVVAVPEDGTPSFRTGCSAGAGIDTDSGALTSSRTPALAAAVCSDSLAAVVRAPLERAGVRLAGVRVVADFAVEVRGVVDFVVVVFAAAVRAVVDRAVFGAAGAASDAPVASDDPVVGAALAGVRFAGVARVVEDFVAVVLAAAPRAVDGRAAAGLAGVAPSAASVVVVVRVRGVLGRFAGAFVVPAARGVVVRGARFADGEAACSPEAVVAASAVL